MLASLFSTGRFFIDYRLHLVLSRGRNRCSLFFCMAYLAFFMLDSFFSTGGCFVDYCLHFMLSRGWDFFCFFFFTTMADTIFYTGLCTGCCFSDRPFFWIIVTCCLYLLRFCFTTVDTFICLYSGCFAGWRLGNGSFIPDMCFLFGLSNVSDKYRIRTGLKCMHILSCNIVNFSLFQFFFQAEIVDALIIFCFSKIRCCYFFSVFVI